LIAEVISVVQRFPYAGIFLLLILGAIGLPVPEDATLFLCGVLISQGTVHPVPAFLAAYSGALVSDFIIFSIGKKYGRKLMTNHKFQRILSPEKLRFVENKFKKFGPLLILLGRHILGFRAQLILVAGTLGFPSCKFLLIDSVAAALTVTFMVMAGYTGGTWLRHIWGENAKTGQIAILLFIGAALVFLLFKRLASRQNADSCD
jgi:membrane protein DedA with SNARE-associated domain